MGSTVLDTLVRDQPLQPDRRVPRPEAVQADRRRPAVLPRRVLLDERRLHAARRSASAAIRGSAAGCRTAIPPRTCRGSRRLTSVKGRAHAARRRRRPPRAARPHRRRQPLGAADVRSHLHAAVQRREHADAEQPRAVAGRLRARPADVGVDQRHAALDASATTGRPPSARTRGVSADLTLNAGLRFEYETGVREKDGHMIVGWDPTATNCDHRRGAGGVPGERAAEPGRHAGDAQRRSADRSTPATPGVSQPGRGDVDAARRRRRTCSASARCSRAATACTTTR